VSTVLLYGVPIVSLYIEGQERLCLAQISNTLLKQFSYNEIHNRRVALGITCVQCTPVQLEILRRAGAMPVSSRRCGMITRREAERLCKSFLGDNTPPRLPEDFAFSVQHKCAWGCRGSFLPSRYNSSRAKCIKCSYCGMFFSPNKFIFHSHRITSNDRYVQPDAANFNSWRRHMTLLNGNNISDEKITHAWEDVKAMFNGGTRKRLVGSGSSSNNNNNRNQNSSPLSGVLRARTSCISPTQSLSIDRDLNKSLSTEEESMCPTLDKQYKYSTVAAATAAVVAAVGVPFNFDDSNASLSGDHHLSVMPISRNFVVDYMWQHKDHQHYEQQFSKKLESNLETFEFESNYPKSWGKPQANVMGNSVRLSDNITTHKNRKLMGIEGGGGNTSLADYKIPSILSCSAFKPVVASTAIVSTSLYTRSSDLNKRNDNINSSQATRRTTVLTHNTTSHRIFNNDSALSPISDKESKPKYCIYFLFIIIAYYITEKLENSFSKKANDNTNDSDDNGDDDEVVDIETTEDESKFLSNHESSESNSFSQTTTNIDVEADVDVDIITTEEDDAVDQLELISSSPSIKNASRSSLSIFKTEHIQISGPTSSADTKGKLCNDEEFNINGESNGLNGQHLKIITRRKTDKAHHSHVERCCNQKQYFNKPLVSTQNLSSSSSSLQIQQRLSFPVFLKSHLHSFRPLHYYPQSRPVTTTFSPDSTTGDSNKWSNTEPSLSCYYEKYANYECLD
ncbi:hypothetical protein KR032_006876, partial [Drosophila birchii]